MKEEEEERERQRIEDEAAALQESIEKFTQEQASWEEKYKLREKNLAEAKKRFVCIIVKFVFVSVFVRLPCVCVTAN